MSYIRLWGKGEKGRAPGSGRHGTGSERPGVLPPGERAQGAPSPAAWHDKKAAAAVWRRLYRASARSGRILHRKSRRGKDLIGCGGVQDCQKRKKLLRSFTRRGPPAVRIRRPADIPDFTSDQERFFRRWRAKTEEVPADSSGMPVLLALCACCIFPGCRAGAGSVL